MQHSQIRQKYENIKIFAKQNPLTVQKTLNILKFNGTNVVDITPRFTVDSLNEGYYSTTFNTPNEDCYLIIKFCGSPMVIRVGSPELQFIIYNKPSRVIDYIHYNETGVEVKSGLMSELQDGFYYYTPIEDTLGYVEIYGKPSIIEIPYCAPHTGVAIDIEWTKKTTKREFGTKTLKQNFKSKTVQHNINIKNIKQSFGTKTSKESFKTKIIKQTFKAKVCS